MLERSYGMQIVPSRLLLNMQRRGLTGIHKSHKFANVGRSLFQNKNFSFQGPAFRVILLNPNPIECLWQPVIAKLLCNYT